MNKLVELDLSRTQIGDEDLKSLSAVESLKFLYLDGTNVTEAGLVHLQSLRNLAFVSLDDTQVSEDAASEFNDTLGESW